MPAFAQNAGGMLTDDQITFSSAGFERWAKPDALPARMPPPYAAPTPGDPKHGAGCLSSGLFVCVTARKAGSILDGSYLALVSDQHLRTMVIVGRPNWVLPTGAAIAGKPISPEDVSDLVAWLAAQRPQFSRRRERNERRRMELRDAALW